MLGPNRKPCLALQFISAALPLSFAGQFQPVAPVMTALCARLTPVMFLAASHNSLQIGWHFPLHHCFRYYNIDIRFRSNDSRWNRLGAGSVDVIFIFIGDLALTLVSQERLVELQERLAEEDATRTQLKVPAVSRLPLLAPTEVFRHPKDRS